MINQKQQVTETLWINEQNAAEKIPAAGGQFPVVLESEQRLLGTLLSAGEAGKANGLFLTVRYLSKQDFFKQAYGLIWRAMERCVEEKLQITTTSVKNKLQAFGKMGQVGDATLTELMMVGGSQVESFAQEIFKASVCRFAMYQGRQMGFFSQNGMNLSLLEFQQRLAGITQPVSQRLSQFTQRDRIDLLAASAQFDTVLNPNTDFKPGIPTGFSHFDKITLGLCWRKLYLFAAPQGWGKTAWLLCLAVAMLRSGRRVKFNSLEMSREEIMERMMSIMALVNSTAIRSRKLSRDEVSRLKHAKQELLDNEASRYFVIQRFISPTLEELDSALTDDQMTFTPDVQFLDYLGRDTISVPARLDDNGAAGLIYGKLKGWKDTLGPAFVAAAQMNSNWEKKKDKRPGLLSIRYGTIAVNAADVIGYIYHENKVKKTSVTDEAELIIQKNRSGPQDQKLKLMFNYRPECFLFTTNPLQTEAEAIEDEGE